MVNIDRVKNLQDESILRYKYIDFFRGFLCILMLIYHSFLFNYLPRAGLTRPMNIVELFINNMGGIIAPNFLLISGFSFVLFLKKRVNSDKLKLEVTIRGILLFFIGIIINLVYTNIINSLIDWTILEIIGIGTISTFLINKKKTSSICGIIIILFILGYFALIDPNSILYYLFGRGFSLFPYINFFFIGFLIGRYILTFDEKGLRINKNKIFWILISIGAVLSSFYNYTYYPQEYVAQFSTIYVENIFFFLLLIYCFSVITKPKTRLFFLKDTVEMWGQVSLTFYYVSFGLIFIYILGDKLFLNGFMENNMNFLLFFILIVASLIVFGIAVRIWKKFSYKFGMEWLIRIIPTKIINHLKSTEKTSTDR